MGKKRRVPVDVITVNSPAGANLVKYKPVFSHDSKYLFVLSGHIVKIFSTESGECFRQLRKHVAEVTSCIVNPRNQLQLITTSIDGEIIFWDYLDGIYHICHHMSKGVLRLIWPSKNSPLFIITGEYDLYTLSNLNQPQNDWKVICKKVSSANRVAVGLTDAYVAALASNSVLVYDIAANKKISHAFSGRAKLTCIAAHPSAYCIATGDSMGKIHLWYNFLDNVPTRNSVHWHQLPVADISFTAAGSSFLSGGGECVLVRWKIDSDTKTFVPRLGMPIVHVTSSPNSRLVATSHVDNAIQLLDSQGDVVHVIQGLTKGHQWNELGWAPIPTGMLYDPRSKALVMNGKPGHLQFFLVPEDKQLFNLDITGVNYLHKEREFKVYPIEVEKAAFDSKGNWLATVERRDDNKTTPDIRLKIWEYKEECSNFVLNTKIEEPHVGRITSLKFKPTSESETAALLVTTSIEDKRFKCWRLIDDSDIYKKKSSWNCESAGYFRDMPCGDADFSEDGSVLAIACDYIVSLWSSDNCDLKASLCHPILQKSVLQVEFGLKQCSRLIVCVTRNSVDVWDIISLTIKWCVDVNVACLTKDPRTSFFALFTQSRDLFVFDPSSPSPVFTCTNACYNSILNAVFIPNQVNKSKFPWQQHSTLYFLNEDQLLLQITTKSELQETSTKNVPIQSNVPLTPFAMLLAKERKSGVLPVEEARLIKSKMSTEVLQEMCHSPSNTLPPIQVLCDLYLNSFLTPKEKNKDDEEDGEMKKLLSDSGEPMEFDSDKEFEADDKKSGSEVRQEVSDTGLDSKVKINPNLDEETELKKIISESYDWLVKKLVKIKQDMSPNETLTKPE